MTDPIVKRRNDYVKRLYGLDGARGSANPAVAAQSRRQLAVLRNSFTDGRQVEAYEIVFRADPPDNEAEQDTWLLVGGLYALHPKVWKSGPGPRTLGASFGRLAKKLDNTSVHRRFTQLLARDGPALPHHLRQAVRLLSAHDVPVDYHALLDDLVVLLGNDPRGDRAGRIRLKWAREYHMPVSAERDEEPVDTTEPPEPTT